MVDSYTSLTNSYSEKLPKYEIFYMLLILPKSYIAHIKFYSVIDVNHLPVGDKILRDLIHKFIRHMNQYICRVNLCN